MSRRWLKLEMAAPLMAFGAVAVDRVGPTWRWPGRSMLTGLLANALGYHWRDRDAHQALQDRLVCGAALLREGEILTDIQNARLGKSDKGWTTRGEPEGRDGDSYGAPQRRQRDFLADAELVAVLTLAPEATAPGLEALRDALLRPARPLYLGRKPCLPARPLVTGQATDFLQAPTAHAALEHTAGKRHLRAFWPEGEGPVGQRGHETADMRHWQTGLHGGVRIVQEGYLNREGL